MRIGLTCRPQVALNPPPPVSVLPQVDMPRLVAKFRASEWTADAYRQVLGLAPAEDSFDAFRVGKRGGAYYRLTPATVLAMADEYDRGEVKCTQTRFAVVSKRYGCNILTFRRALHSLLYTRAPFHDVASYYCQRIFTHARDNVPKSYSHCFQRPLPKRPRVALKVGK